MRTTIRKRPSDSRKELHEERRSEIDVLRFVEVARHFQIQGNVGWILVGGRKDVELTNQVAKRLQASKPDLKVIYTSGYTMNLQGTSFNIRDGGNFLQKPYRPEHLFNAIRDCLDQR